MAADRSQRWALVVACALGVSCGGRGAAAAGHAVAMDAAAPDAACAPLAAGVVALAVRPVRLRGAVAIAVDSPALPPPCQDARGQPLQVLELVPDRDATSGPGGLFARVPLACDGRIDALVEPGVYRAHLVSASQEWVAALELGARLALGGEAHDLGTVRVRLVEVAGRLAPEGRAGLGPEIAGTGAEGCGDVQLESANDSAQVTAPLACSGSWKALVPPGAYRVSAGGRLALPRPGEPPRFAYGRQVVGSGVDLSRPRADVDLPLRLVRAMGRVEEEPGDPNVPPPPCLGVERVLRLRPAPSPSQSPLWGERQLALCNGAFDGLIAPADYTAEVVIRTAAGDATELPVPEALRLDRDATALTLAPAGTNVAGVVRLGGAALHAPAGAGPFATVELEDASQPRRATTLVRERTPAAYSARVPAGVYQIWIAGAPGNGVLPESRHMAVTALAISTQARVVQDLELSLHRVSGLVRLNGADPTAAACGVPTEIVFRRRDVAGEAHAFRARCADGRLIFDGAVYAGRYAVEVRRGGTSVGRGVEVRPLYALAADDLNVVLDAPESAATVALRSRGCALPATLRCDDGNAPAYTLTLDEPERLYRFLLPRLPVADPVPLLLPPGRYRAEVTLSQCAAHPSAPVTSSLKADADLLLGR